MDPSVLMSVNPSTPVGECWGHFTIHSLNGGESLPLVLGELGVPHIHDEDEPVAVGVLPHLVLKGVIKDEHFPLLPSPGREQKTNHSLSVNEATWMSL